MSLIYTMCLPAASPIFLEVSFRFNREMSFMAGKGSLRKWKEGRTEAELAQQTSVSSSALLLDLLS